MTRADEIELRINHLFKLLDIEDLEEGERADILDKIFELTVQLQLLDDTIISRFD